MLSTTMHESPSPFASGHMQPVHTRDRRHGAMTSVKSCCSPATTGSVKTLIDGQIKRHYGVHLKLGTFSQNITLTVVVPQRGSKPRASREPRAADHLQAAPQMCLSQQQCGYINAQNKLIIDLPNPKCGCLSMVPTLVIEFSSIRPIKTDM